jgi:hypothetical protein
MKQISKTEFDNESKTNDIKTFLLHWKFTSFNKAEDGRKW